MSDNLPKATEAPVAKVQKKIKVVVLLKRRFMSVESSEKSKKKTMCREALTQNRDGVVVVWVWSEKRGKAEERVKRWEAGAKQKQKGTFFFFNPCSF